MSKSLQTSTHPWKFTLPNCFKSLFPPLNYLIIMIMMALKGASWDFLQSPLCAANCFQHICQSGQDAIMCKSRATHQAPITCNMSCATWYEGTAQPLSLREFKIAFILVYFNGWNNNRWSLFQEVFTLWVRKPPLEKKPKHLHNDDHLYFSLFHLFSCIELPSNKAV